jgi:CheY-like chemotaxis protein
VASVLVVDDEVFIAQVVREAIRDTGHRVVTAHSAPEAYRCLAREPSSFAAVVADIDLGPGGNGFEVVRQARELNPEIRVAYMTGNAANLRNFEPDRALLFPKPFSPSEMAEQLDLLIG